MKHPQPPPRCPFFSTQKSEGIEQKQEAETQLWFIIDSAFWIRVRSLNMEYPAHIHLRKLIAAVAMVYCERFLKRISYSLFRLRHRIRELKNPKQHNRIVGKLWGLRQEYREAQEQWEEWGGLEGD